MTMPAPTRAMGDSEPGPDSFDSHVVETHISYVVFVGDRVYKLKKAVVTDFVDFRTAEARQAACEAEVALNSRLAPDVYLGVAVLTGPETGRRDGVIIALSGPHRRHLGAHLGSVCDPVMSQRVRPVVPGRSLIGGQKPVSEMRPVKPLEVHGQERDISERVSGS